MERTRRILLLGPEAPRVVETARALGLHCVVLDKRRNGPRLREAPDGAVGAFPCEDEVVELARAHEVDGIYPTTRETVSVAAQVCAVLQLPGPGIEAAGCLSDTTAARDRLLRADVLCPPLVCVTTLSETQQALGEIGLPVMVKPADGPPGHGAQQVDYVEDLSLAVDLAKRHSPTDRAILESVLAGQAFYVDALMHEGRFRLGGIIARETSEPPFSFDEGLFTPPPLEPAAQADLVEAAQRALAAIGFHTGAARVKLLLTPDGVHVLTTLAWPPPGPIPTDLVRSAQGIDLLADALRMAIGEPPVEVIRRRRAAALYWIPARPGVVVAIEGLDAARAVAGVTDAQVFAAAGARLGHIVDPLSRDRVGYVLAEADEPAAAVEAARRACGLCRIVTQPTV